MMLPELISSEYAESPAHDWRATATIGHQRARARLLRDIRAFFEVHNVLEVETPLLSEATTPDPNLHSLTTKYTGPGHPQGKSLYLQTSPEFAMKRLLACGSGSIYQICKAFRDGETGNLHNPEFTLLEWYRTGYGYQKLMDEVDDLVSSVLGIKSGFLRLTYRQAFEQYAGFNPHDASVELMQNYVARFPGVQVHGLSHDNRDDWLDLIMSHMIEPQLGTGQPVFIYDYPVSKAALAYIRNDSPAVAERFELYIGGIELANGFSELSDQQETRLRFEHDREKRLAEKLPDVCPDRRILAALDHGLPPCAGVALGLDRLLMVRLGASSIREVLSFPVDRA